MGLSVHGSRAKNLQWGEERGISDSLSSATWVLIRELILSGAASCRHRITTAAKAKRDGREVLSCGVAGEWMLQKVTKERKDVRRRWWDIPQGRVVLETQLDLCHRLFPAEIRKTWRKVSWLLAIGFPVPNSTALPSCPSSWARSLQKGRRGSRGHLLTYQGACFPSCPRDPRQTLAALRERDRQIFFSENTMKHQKI